MKEKIKIFTEKIKEVGSRIRIKRGKTVYFSLGGGGVVLLILFFFLALPLWGVYREGVLLRDQGRKLKAAVGEKDLEKIKKEMGETESLLLKIDNQWRKLSWLKFIPGLKSYYLDGKRVILVGNEGLISAKIIVAAVSPYADFLGLKSQGGGDGEKTTEDRIEFLTKSIAELKPKINEIEKHFSVIEEEVGKIDPERYPQKIRGVPLREKIWKGRELALQLSQLVKEGKPLLERADWLLGKEEERRYLFFFQNDGELRPTGGFWTAYGILAVKEGKVSPLKSEDIYALDARFNSLLPPPRPIKEYHKNVYYWYLRDMNLSPDFKISVEKFLPYYQKTAGSMKVDGVIAVDTQFLVDLLRVLGPVGVPGWGNFKPDPDKRCFGCPQVVYQLELLADKPLSTWKANRKGFLAPLLHSIIINILGSPKEKLTPLAETIWKNAKSKHILIYFPDPELEKGIEGIGLGGRIKEFDGDYFHFNDSNFAGAKSNLFITEEIKHEYQFSPEGEITVKVTINYRNSAPSSNCNLEKGGLCLNGLYRDWFRLYVPQGSELKSLIGSEVRPVVYNELGKTVFEGFFGDQYPLRPEGIARVVYQYKLPFRVRKGLSLLIQKQAGKKAVKHEIWINGKKKKEVMVDGDVVIPLRP